MGRLGAQERLGAEQNFDLWLAQQPEPMMPVVDDFVAARALVQTAQVALRAADALHLAVCLRIGASLATFDIRLAEAAAHFGAPVTAF